MAEELKELRNQIDKIDLTIIKLLKDREDLVKKVAKIKFEKNLALEQPEREKEICDRPKEVYIKEIFKIIIEESKNIQRREFHI